MSKAANKTMIGAFVLGAVGLAVIAVLIFGSGKFFTQKLFYEMYFEGSVQGLDVGSPVMFHGVKIGSVTEIGLQFDPKRLVFYIPVTIAIEPDKAKRFGPPPKKAGELIKPLIDKGLRGQLQTTSFVTGQLVVAVDFFPDKPAKYVGLDKRYPEVPTVPSTIAQLTKTVQELPIHDLFENLSSSVAAINALVTSGEAKASVKSLNRTLGEATTVMKTVNARIGPLAASLQNTSDGINTVAAQKTLAQAETALASVQAMTQENSNMGYELGNALSEMSRSMRSLRVLGDYLERHPEALLMGKKSR
ncbi:MAG: MlaD family protein [Syntrophorhabdales bacterium]